jgi:hypothetical protein
MRKSFQYCQAEAEKLMQRRKVHWYHLLLMPIWRFVLLYFAKRGLRDGTPGLIIALHSACATFRTYALVWDEQHQLPRPEPLRIVERMDKQPRMDEPSRVSEHL